MRFQVSSFPSPLAGRRRCRAAYVCNLFSESISDQSRCSPFAFPNLRSRTLPPVATHRISDGQRRSVGFFLGGFAHLLSRHASLSISALRLEGRVLDLDELGRTARGTRSKKTW